MKHKYRETITACFVGYVIQAVVNNFVPLLFVMFQTGYGISLSKITTLISINFFVQLIVDLLSAGFIDKIGYRASVIVAHVFSAAGLVLLTVLPEVSPDPFTGILAAVIIYAIGGGLLEVLLSPMIEACPTRNKEKMMSICHSFYSWGQVGVVLISTLFFAVFGIENWKIIALIWAVIPICNGIAFTKVPVYSLDDGEEKGLNIKELFANKLFWLFMIMMMCAGASESTIAQWASAFAEEGLGVSKAVGDLAGPMSFAFLMGISRVIYGKYGHKLDLDRFILFSSALCIAAYLCVSLIPIPVFGLIGCAVSGFAVGIFWPGTYSKASATIRGGGTSMFALLALAGDMGCTSGPALAGAVSSAFGNNLSLGILASTVFPILMLLSVSVSRKKSE